VVVVILDVVPDVADVPLDVDLAAIFPRASNVAQSYNSTKCITFPIPTVAKRPNTAMFSTLVNANVKMVARMVVAATQVSMPVLPWLHVDVTKLTTVELDVAAI